MKCSRTRSATARRAGYVPYVIIHLMSIRRMGAAALTLAVGATAVLIMVRYTRGVEARLSQAVPTGSVKLLKERTGVPAFTAPDVNGKMVSTGALHNKVVLINFW